MKRAMIAFAVGMAVSSGAIAEQGAWLGFAVGETDLDISVSDIDDGSFLFADADSKSTSFRLGGGYNLNENFGLEASYADFGSGAISAVSDGSGSLFPAGTVDASLEGTAMSFGGIGYVPFNSQVRGVGRFGISMWDSSGSVSTGGISVSISDDGSDPYLGIGVEADMGSSVSGSFSYVRYDFDDADVSSIELGVKLHLKK